MIKGLLGVTPRPDLALTIQQESTIALDAYVMHRVFPIFEVGVSTAAIPSLLRRREVYRIRKAKGGGYNRVRMAAGTSVNFTCQDEGLEEPVDAKDAELYGGMDEAIRMTGIGLTEDMLRARDAAGAALLFTTGTFGAGYNRAAVGTWGGGASNPISDANDAIESVRLSCGMQANRCLISAGLYAKARKDPVIQARYRAIMGYTNGQAGTALQINLQALALVLGVDEVIVAGGIRETTDDGQTRVKASVWADTFALFYYQPPEGTRFGAYLGRTFVWNQGLTVPIGDTQAYDALRGLELETYDDTRNNERVVRVRQYADYPLLNRDSGFLVTGC